jgi:molybdenum cofactor guanylyltransferase
MKNITISILCGGKSTRMQTEKGLVLYQDKFFINHVIDAVLPISDNIQIITGSKDYDFLSYPKMKDIFKDKGPIGGIYTALSNSETDLNLILSCDIPLISTKILSELVDFHQDSFEISVLEDAGGIHPLIGIYSKKMISKIKKAIDENDLKMMHLLSKVIHQTIYVDEHKSRFLKNINSVAELNMLNAN